MTQLSFLYNKTQAASYLNGNVSQPLPLFVYWIIIVLQRFLSLFLNMTKSIFSLLLQSSQLTYSTGPENYSNHDLGQVCSCQVSMSFYAQLASHLLPWEWVYMGLVQEVAEVQLPVEEAECLKDSALPLWTSPPPRCVGCNSPCSSAPSSHCAWSSQSCCCSSSRRCDHKA